VILANYVQFLMVYLFSNSVDSVHFAEYSIVKKAHLLA
jgi:hypothetical protein